MDFLKILIAMPLIQILISYLIFIPLSLLNISVNPYISICLQQVFAVFMPTYLYFRRQNRPYIRKKDVEIGSIPNVFMFIILGIVLQFSGSLANIPVIYLFDHFGFSPVDLVPPIKTFFEFLVATVTICLMPAIFEEVLFRRLIYNHLRRQSEKVAILFSAIFFSLAHMNFYNVGAAFFIGIVFGVMRSKKYPLILLMVTHFTVNFTANMLKILLSNERFANIFTNYYLLLLIVSITVLIVILKSKPKFHIQLEIPYSTRFNFLKTLIKTPYTYIYLAIFIFIGVKNL